MREVEAVEFEQIRYQVVDRIAFITLNRPERLNAFTPVMRDELLQALEAADWDDEVRVLIVTGEGRAFCAGHDMASGEGTTFADGSRSIDKHRDGGGLVALRLYNLKKPVIAAINGPAVGVGLTVTLPMDIRIAADKARMGLVFTRRGIVPESCSTWFLPRLVGVERALEWAMTGRVFSAQEALEAGLVSRVVPPDELMPAALDLAREIADNASTVAVALTRQLIWRMLGAGHPMAAHKLDSKCVFYMSQTLDSQEGVNSFMEKRPPRFELRPSADMPGFYPWWDEPGFD